MGHSARPRNVTLLVPALAEALDAQGADVDPEAGLGVMRDRLG
jgi:alanine-glyoxylate transaminase/serine-glyoxylate transaminase/serine-pyruvate transaminase